MTLFDALNEVATELGYNLIYADLEEANLGITDNTQYPIVLVMPFEVRDSYDTIQATSRASLITYFLQKDISQNTVDYRSVQKESIIAERRAAARKFFNTLYEHSIIDRTRDRNEIVHTPVYNQLDAAIHGVMNTTDIYFIEGGVGC
jgi:hypothetical protein